MKVWLREQLARLGVSTDFGADDSDRDEALKILLVDDTPTNIQVLSHTLGALGHKLLVANSGKSALDIASRHRPELVLLDVMMPQMDGYETCRRLKEDPRLRNTAVIFCSALSDTEAKVKGFELGAVDFITKPYQPDEVIARVTTHLTMQQLAVSLQGQNEHLQKQLDIAKNHQRDALEKLELALLGESSCVKILRVSVAEHAKSDGPLLLYGMAGCGEEAVARAIHAASDRSGRSFIVTDCSEFLGDTATTDSATEGSSFDGETKSEFMAKYELAEGGTLFLDRLHLLPAHLQEQLLDQIDLTSADDRTKKSSALETRLIAFSATDGRPLPIDFHPALAQRLGKATLHLPALSERREDLGAIAAKLLKRHARRLGKSLHGFDPETMKSIEAHSWPGNLRELEDVIVRGVAAARGHLVRVESSLLDGSVSIGGYRLINKIGEGGMGEVWRAKHQLLVRPAAIKLIRPPEGGTVSQAVTERFRREASATARLCCPNTVTLYDFGVTEAGDFYYVMELLDGLDLETLVEEYGKVHPGRVAHFLIQACHSLAEAHSLNLVHRDIKPANLFITRLGTQVDILKVLDFGLVGSREDTNETRLTKEGALYGTPDYIAPEMALDSTKLDGKSDVYCLGASMYTALTGERLFSGNNLMQLLMKHVMEEPLPISDFVEIPPEFERLIMRCLKKKPEERPSALELKQEIQAGELLATWTEQAANEWWLKNLPNPG